MIAIVRWVINWILKNGAVSVHTSQFAEGTRIGGHDIPQLKDLYVIVDIEISAKHTFKGFWQAT
jgi:hypothetical protein